MTSVSASSRFKLDEEKKREGKENKFERTKFLRLAPFEIRECFAGTCGDFSNKGVPVRTKQHG